MKKIDLRIIDSLQGFKDLENDWNDLYNQSDRNTIFSSWDWMITWWEVFQTKDKRELLIICLYENNELVGIAPLQIEKSYPISFLQGKTLRFIGSNSKNEIMTEYSDFIIKSGFEKTFSKAVSEYLTQNKKHWDFADFEFLQEDSLVLECFKHSSSSISSQIIQYGVRYVVPKMSSAEEYQSHIKSRWSKKYKRCSRALEKDGSIVIEGIDDPKNIKPAFETLADMHRERWQGKIEDNCFDMDEFNQFHLKILERLIPKKKADIVTLKHNDKAIASFYSFEDKGQIHYYQSGFYNENANRYSPLFILICNQIGEISENNKIFDFMFDDDLKSYKQEQYSADQKKMYRLKLSPQPYRLVLFNSIRNMIESYRSTEIFVKNKLFPDT